MPVLDLFYFGSLTSLVPSIKLQEILIMMVCLHSGQIALQCIVLYSMYCIMYCVLFESPLVLCRVVPHCCTLVPCS